MKPVIKATVETVCVIHGKLSASSLFDELFVRYLNTDEA